MKEIYLYVNLICIYRTSVYPELKSWYQEGLVKAGLTVYFFFFYLPIFYLCYLNKTCIVVY